MRYESYQQFAIVQGDSAQQLTEQLNAKLYDLRTKRPVVTFEGLIARISYEEEVVTPENLEDEYSLKGVRLSCQDCPFFEPLLKKDGMPNRAAKRGDCRFATYGFTHRDSSACERLFQMINNGEVRLCLAE
jgi:hypothetical protein